MCKFHEHKNINPVLLSRMTKGPRRNDDKLIMTHSTVLSFTEKQFIELYSAMPEHGTMSACRVD